MQTPGVYSSENAAFPKTVPAIPTAIPVFLGHTFQTEWKGRDLCLRPTPISSLADYENIFGTGPDTKFSVSTDNPPVVKELPETYFLLYNSLRLFFANGGGRCYIVSTGSYGQLPSKDLFVQAFDNLEKEEEPTLLVLPDALLLGDAYYQVAIAALEHCGRMQNRMALLDVSAPAATDPLQAGGAIEVFRNSIQSSFLNYGAAYFPFLNTTVVTADEVSFVNLQQELSVYMPSLNANTLHDSAAAKALWQDAFSKKDSAALLAAKKLIQPIHKVLLDTSPTYKKQMETILHKLNQLPPSPAMAGIYTLVDSTHGVWKAPANVSLNAVSSPIIPINDAQQDPLNTDLSGKSINAIRAFAGLGTLVWGARTLDGNSTDWRYINIRRTLIMIEQSIRLMVKAFAFEPNTAQTWVSVKSQITDFLAGLWKQGALAGAEPDLAFSVNTGLGETMTADDLLNGMLRISVLVAISRPAEFTEISFAQQMQKS
jgi:phage tail sheath protein FI